MATNTIQIASMDDILSSFFANIIAKENTISSATPLLSAMKDIYAQKTTSSICTFCLDDNAIATAINQLKDHLRSCNPDCLKSFNTPLTYLLDELICNIQQHAQTERGFAFLEYNAATNYIEIIIADLGITIYGSYVAAQKHLDKLGNSDAEALNLAQKGYSVKNLPDAENRGYGISSSIRMVVDGLQGEFAVLSGNALLVQSATQKKILDLPKEIDYKGTMIVIKIPATIPEGFNLYSYTS